MFLTVSMVVKNWMSAATPAIRMPLRLWVASISIGVPLARIIASSFTFALRLRRAASRSSMLSAWSIFFPMAAYSLSLSRVLRFTRTVSLVVDIDSILVLGQGDDFGFATGLLLPGRSW